VAKKSRVVDVTQGGGEVATTPKGLVGVDAKIADVLQLEQEGPVSFDPAAMPVFAEDDVRQLGYETVKAYHIALGARKSQEKLKRQEVRGIAALSVKDPLEFSSKARRLRPRRGWHQTWARSDLFDDMMEVGYRQVRKPKEGTEEGPGEETGEVIKYVDGQKDGQPIYAIQVEIPEAVYWEHERVVGYKSQVRYSADVLETLKYFMKGINREVGKRKEVFRVVDDSEAQREVVRTHGGPMTEPDED